MSDTNQQNTENTSTEPDKTSDSTPPTPKTEEKTFLQSEVNKMMAREKSQGRTAAYRDLGIDPKDTDKIDEIKKFLQSKKPDAQVFAEKQIEQQNKINEANQRAFLAEVKAEIMQSGIQLSYLDDAMALVMAKKTDDTFDLPAAIDTIKTKYPVWFNAENANPPKGLTGTGNPIKPGNSAPKQDDLGKRLAEQRKSGSAKTTYWGK